MGGSLAVWVGAVAIVAALPALLSRRGGPAGSRTAAGVAMAGIWLIAWDWPRAEREVVPAPLVGLAVGGDGRLDDRAQAAFSALRSRLAVVDASGPVEFSVEAVAGDDAAAIARALMRASVATQGARDGVFLTWVGPVASAPMRAVVPGVRLHTVAPPSLLEGDDFTVTSVRRARVDRPAALECVWSDVAQTAAAPWRGALRVVDPDGALVASVDVAGGGPDADARDAHAVLHWRPAVAGTHGVELRVTWGDGVGELAAVGAIDVEPAAPALVVGGSPAEVAALTAALAVQGIPVDASASLPMLEDARAAEAVVVLLADLEAAAEQERLRAWVEAEGGGVLWLAGRDGAALPADGEPLFPLLPLRPLPPSPAPAADPVAAASPGDAGDGANSLPDPSATPESSPTDPKSSEPETPDVPPARDPDAPPPPAVGPPSGDPELATGATQASPPGPGADRAPRRAVALVLVVDRSGSMQGVVRAGATRMDYAKRAAFETARGLVDGDLLALISFGSRGRIELPLGPTPDSATVRAACEGLRAARGESTSLSRGLETVREVVGQPAARRLGVRHVVVVTDGEFIDPEINYSKFEARKLQQLGATLSFVHIKTGVTKDLRLEDLARSLGGNYARTEDPSTVPALVLAEVRRVVGDGPGAGDPSQPGDGTDAVDEGPADHDPVAEPDAPDDPSDVSPPPPAETPEPPPSDDPTPPADDQQPEPAPEPATLAVRALVDSVLLAPAPDADFPPVGGVAPAVGLRRARTLLVAGDDGIPLLAFANRGLGRVGVWNGDLLGDDGAAWRASPEFPGRLARWLEHLRPPPQQLPERDVLGDDRRVTPRGPTRAELERLGRIALGPVGSLDEVRRPRATRRTVRTGRAVEFAWAAAASLLLLGVVEWLLRRRSAA